MRLDYIASRLCPRYCANSSPEKPPSSVAPRAPGPVSLVATGCGTAIACVCALGLGEIERRLGGIGRCWRSPARRCCARRWRARSGAWTTVVPSGAGLLAFLSRGLGRRWGLLLMLPYVALVLALVAVEARIVGAVSARLLPIPPAVGRARLPCVHLGRRPQRRPPGLRAQAAATACW